MIANCISQYMIFFLENLQVCGKKLCASRWYSHLKGVILWFNNPKGGKILWYMEKDDDRYSIRIVYVHKRIGKLKQLVGHYHGQQQRWYHGTNSVSGVDNVRVFLAKDFWWAEFPQTCRGFIISEQIPILNRPNNLIFVVWKGGNLVYLPNIKLHKFKTRCNPIAYNFILNYRNLGKDNSLSWIIFFINLATPG